MSATWCVLSDWGTDSQVYGLRILESACVRYSALLPPEKGEHEAKSSPFWARIFLSRPRNSPFLGEEGGEVPPPEEGK